MRSTEPGEGHLASMRQPLTRLASLGTFSPFHGEREKKVRTSDDGGESYSAASLCGAAGFFAQ